MVGEIGQRHHAGVVHEHVDGAESVQGVPCRRFDLSHVRHVGNMNRAVEAGGPNALENLVQALSVDVHADDLRATGSALFGNQLAEAATRTGDDDDLVLQVLRLTYPSYPE